MRLRRIQSSGVFVSTPFILLVLSGAFLLTPRYINAQCPAGAVPRSVTYTQPLHTVSTSGGKVYSFTLPQFNPSLPAPGGYTLLSAVLSATATTNIDVNYQNTSTTTGQDIFPTAARTDNVKVNGTTAVNKNNQYDYPETILAIKGSPGDNVSYTGTTFDNSTPLFTTTITTASPALTGTYTGAGNLSLTYTSTFFMNNSLSTDIAVTHTIDDNITFTITYNYCDPNVLASNILNFTASKVNNQTVDLKWLTTNEQPGRKYYIEVGSDGQNFTTAGLVLSNASSTDASYTYAYPIPPAATGKLYFRLRQVEIDGTATWSDVRIINLDGNGSTFSIYPNPPSDYINLTIPGNNQDWQVNIFAANGSLVQSNYYRNSNTARVNFVRRLAAGAYFVRATNPQTSKHYTGSFVVSK